MYDKKIKERERDHVDYLGNGIESIGVCLQRENKSILNRLLPLGN
jgi:hypothetical protein